MPPAGTGNAAAKELDGGDRNFQKCGVDRAER